MGKPIPYDYRVKIVQRRKAGESAQAIAETIPYSKSAVDKLWARYKDQGEDAFETQYANCGRPRKYGEDTDELVAKVRDNSQGADYVVSKLQQYHSEKEIPSARTLQRRWLEQKTNSPKGRPLEENATEKKNGQKKPTILGK